MVEIEAAEAEISWLLFLNTGEAPKPLDPYIPIMQLNNASF